MHVDKAPVRLPLRCTPFPGESLTGLLIRLAERNGLARGQMLGHVSIGELPALYPTAIGLRRLVAASGIPSGTLEGMCFGQGIFGAPPKSLALQGVEIPVGWVTWKLAVCPACLAESPHHRTKWHLLLITVCPLHDCPILRACPACGRRLRWERWPAVSCDCGWNIRDARRPMAGQADISGPKWIWDLGRGHPAPRLLSAVRFKAAVDFTLALGCALAGLGAHRNPYDLDRLDQYLRAGYRALDSDLEGFSLAVREAMLNGTPVVLKKLRAVTWPGSSDDEAIAAVRNVVAGLVPEPRESRRRY